MTTAIFVESKNRWLRKDGDEFLRQGAALHAWHTSIDKTRPIVTNDLKSVGHKPAGRIKMIVGIEYLAFLCHGTRKALIHCQSNIWSVNEMACAIREGWDGESQIKICLYTCSTGKGTGTVYRKEFVPSSAGYAMRLADQLAFQGVNFRIIAHRTSGHTTWNPFKVEIVREHDQIIKRDLVPYVSWWGGRKNPTGRARWKKWCTKVKETDLKWRCANLSIDQIQQYLDYEE
jgi:hypothetical protein